MNYALKDTLQASFSGEWGNDCISGEGVAVLRTTNFTNVGDISYCNVVERDITDGKIQKKKLQVGDIILEKSGGTKNTPVGRVVYFDRADKIYLCNNFTQVLRPNSQIVDGKYLFYCLYAKYQFHVTDGLYNKTTGIQNLQMDRYFNLQIPVVDKEQQYKICKQLDALRAAIEKKKQVLRKFDDLVKSQFIETFLNRGFQRVALEKVSHGKGEYGAASASVEYIPSRPRYVRITDINDDGTLNDDRVCSVNLSDDSDYKLEYGDFLFARMGATVGKTYVYKTGNQIFAGYLIRYKLNTDKINPYYLYSYTKTPEYESWVQLNQSGAAQPGINAKKYGSLQIPLPPMALQNQFAAFVEQTDKSKVLMEQARKLVQILIKLILNIGTIEKSIQICYNGHRKEVV